jgi:hypothetical protein
MIPKDLQEFARELGELAQKHGLHRLHGEFSPGLRSKWNNNVTFYWEAGRHGDAAHKISLSSTQQLNIDVPYVAAQGECSGG